MTADSGPMPRHLNASFGEDADLSGQTPFYNEFAGVKFADADLVMQKVMLVSAGYHSEGRRTDLGSESTFIVTDMAAPNAFLRQQGHRTWTTGQQITQILPPLSAR